MERGPVGPDCQGGHRFRQVWAQQIEHQASRYLSFSPVHRIACTLLTMATTPRDLRCFLTRLDNIPVSFPFLPNPPSSGIGSVHFAFVVRLEAQNSTAWREGPRSSTAGTFHKRDTTLLKTREGNGNVILPPSRQYL